MALDILTWLIASIAILLGYLAAAKFASEPSEKTYAHPQNPLIGEEQSIQQPRISSAPPRIAAQKPSTPQPARKTSKQQAPEQSPQKPSNPSKLEQAQTEKQKEADEMPPPTIARDLENLAKEIQNLKTLLKMSEELREEIEKLTKILKTTQTGKRVN